MPHSLMPQKAWHALVLPVLLDFQPVLLQLRSDHSIGAQLRLFCMQHGLHSGRCSDVMHHAIDELIELRGMVYCKRLKQSSPALLTVRNILPASTLVYPPSFAWLHDESFNMASDLCAFLRSSVDVENNINDCELSLRDAFDESFTWIRSLPDCESEYSHLLHETQLSDRISTVEQMIESLRNTATNNGTMNIITTSDDQKNYDVASSSVNTAPRQPNKLTTETEPDAPHDELEFGVGNLSDHISTIQQMITSSNSEYNTSRIDIKNTDSSNQEAIDNVSQVIEFAVDNHREESFEEFKLITEYKAEHPLLTGQKQQISMEFSHYLICDGNLSRENGNGGSSDNVISPLIDSLGEKDEERETPTGTDSTWKILENQLESNDKEIITVRDNDKRSEFSDYETDSTIMEDHAGEHIGSIIHDNEKSSAAFTEKVALLSRQFLAEIRTESSTPWTAVLILTLLLFIFYLVLDLLSIGIHHLADVQTRQSLARKLKIALISGKNAAIVLPETPCAKISITLPDNFKATDDLTSPPADAAGVISTELYNEARPVSLVNEQRKAMMLKNVAKTCQLRTQKNAMGLWRSASMVNKLPNHELEESQAVHLEPIATMQRTLRPEPKSQDTGLQLSSRIPSFTCAAMTLLFAHHAQYHLPVAKTNMSEAHRETPSLIHPVSVQDIYRLKAAQMIQSAWRAKHKFLQSQRACQSQIEPKPSYKPLEKLRQQLPIFQLLHHLGAKQNDESNLSPDAWTVPASDEFFASMGP